MRCDVAPPSRGSSAGCWTSTRRRSLGGSPQGTEVSPSASSSGRPAGLLRPPRPSRVAVGSSTCSFRCRPLPSSETSPLRECNTSGGWETRKRPKTGEELLNGHLKLRARALPSTGAGVPGLEGAGPDVVRALGAVLPGPGAPAARARQHGAAAGPGDVQHVRRREGEAALRRAARGRVLLRDLGSMPHDYERERELASQTSTSSL